MNGKYVIEQDIPTTYFNLIFFFTLILFLFFFLYVTFVLSTKQPEDIKISKIDYDLLTNQSNQPEFNLQDTANDGSNLTPQERANIYKFAQLNVCPAGQCVVDLNNGGKRCAEDKSITLSYYPTFETCSNPYSCDDAKAPYAERVNGAAFDSNCGGNFPCRCLKNPQCAYQITSTFDNNNGSPYGVNQSQLNYSFKVGGNAKEFFNKDAIVISDDQIDNSFCQLNPAFTSRIVNGCDFSTNINDPVDCKSSNVFSIVQDNEVEITLIPSVLLSGMLGFSTYLQGSDYINVISNIDLIDYQKGFLNITNNNDNTTFQLYYDQISQNNFKDVNLSSITYYTLGNILSKKSTEDTWVKGLPVEIKGSGGNNNTNLYSFLKITWFNMLYQPCTVTSSNDVNYKNMLQCVQPDEQPCIQGVLTYNVDKVIDTNSDDDIYSQTNSRNFCNAFDSTRLDPTKVKKFYLNDPASFTTSCMIGTGCGGEFDSSLCTKEDCNQAVADRKKTFLSNYDDSAVSNFWILSAGESGVPSNYPSFTLTGTNIKINNHALFDLEPGDYWSRYNPEIIVYTAKSANKGATSLTISNENKNDIQIGASIQYTGYTLPLPGITSINENVIQLDRAIVADINNQSPLLIINELDNSNLGVIGKKVDTNQFYLMDINGQEHANLTSAIIADINRDGLVIYKQFGFNGINYNTNVNFDKNTPNKRIYSSSFVYFDYLAQNTSPVFDYLGITNAGLDQDKQSLNAFNDTSSGFKNKKSMYYPVWNNNIFRQECVMCKPNLLAYSTITTNNNLDKIQIQFSGQDFINYIYDQVSDNYVYTTFTKIKKNSNTNYLIMDEVNPNIVVGDYIIDAPGLMEKNFQFFEKNNDIPNNLDNINLFPVDYNNNIAGLMLDNRYGNYQIIDKLGEVINFPTNEISNIVTNKNNSFLCRAENGAVNYFTGKLYQDKNDNTFTIVPLVKVIDIIDNVIITDAGILLDYQEDFFIQTIKRDEFIGIAIEQNIDIGGGTGTNATARVNQITQGRITDIKITDRGQNYSPENKPVILINKYLTSKEINILSV